MKIIFYGTPEFAVPSLSRLIESGNEISAVVTAPDKPAGRGRKMIRSDVKSFAEANSLKILQPGNLKDPEFLSQIRALKPDLQVVVAFRMMPEELWRIPARGTFNLHASLLPQYRGAAPINWAIINGEHKTGLTTFFINKEIDTGNIILQENIDIDNEINAGELHDIMKVRGAELIIRTIQMIIENENMTGIPQGEYSSEDQVIKPAPKLNQQNCRLEWETDPHTVHNKIRGLSPYPGAYTIIRSGTFKSHKLKILKSRVSANVAIPLGCIDSEGKKLFAGCRSGVIEILELQLEGKKKMDGSSFINGYKAELPFNLE